MIGILIQEEIRRLRFERPFIVACVLIGLLSAYATWSGQEWQHHRVAVYHAQVEKLQTEFERESKQIQQLERGELSIADAAAAGLPHLARTELTLPILPTAGWAIGDAELRPTHAAITATTRAHEMFRFQEVDNPLRLGWGYFDLAFLIIFLLPLFILGFTCTALSKERESGVLPLLLSYPVTAQHVATVRVALRSAALLGAILIGKVVMGSLPIGTPTTGNHALFSSGGALFWISALVNTIFWSALALWIVARNQSSEQNALWVIIMWIWWVLLLPAIFTSMTKLSSPLPSRLDYITTARAAENAANQQGRALLEQYLLDHPELEATRGDAVAPFIKTFVLVQERVDQAILPVVARFRDAEDSQNRMADTLKWLSPRDLIERNLLISSGHDAVRFAQFERQAEDLRVRWRAAVEPPLMEGRRLTSDEFANLPRPTYQDPTGDSGRYSTVHLAVVVAFSLVILWWALRQLRQFSPILTEPRGRMGEARSANRLHPN